jgi:TRIAD3 protein (E3 ubiquitin-protein ligase RNF216)
MEPADVAARVVIDLTSDDDGPDDVAIVEDPIRRWNNFAATAGHRLAPQSLHTTAAEHRQQFHGLPQEVIDLDAPQENNGSDQVVEELPRQGPADEVPYLQYGYEPHLADALEADWSFLDEPTMPFSAPTRVLTPAPSEISDADDCLRRALVMFPDIEHDHVRGLWDTADVTKFFTSRARYEEVIHKILAEDRYPRQPKAAQSQRKRKRSESPRALMAAADVETYMFPGRPCMCGFMMATAILKAEFPEMTGQYIYKATGDHTNLFPTFLALAKAREDYELGSTPAFGRGRIANRAYADGLVGVGGSRPDLRAELQAAKRHAGFLARQRAAERILKQKEAENIEVAKAAGAVAECQACFDEMPMNRQIHCDGVVAHFTCYTCAEAYIKAEVGQSRCRVLCTAGCGAGFAPAQINLLADKELLARLARIQQATDIRNAGIEDLEECPFCEYKAIIDVSVDEDSEFRCAAPDCSIVSCRKCHAASHLPQTCKEAEAERRLDGRHRIEEAMTAALVRHCNRCHQQFIKESGCNKMSCSACRNLQCYCCGETVTDYTHFENERVQAVVAAIDDAVARLDPGAQPAQAGVIAPNNGAGAGAAAQVPQRKKKCPLYDNVEERHKRDVEQAEQLARAAVLAENPSVTAEELAINLPVDRTQAAPAGQARAPARNLADPAREEQRRQREMARLERQQDAQEARVLHQEVRARQQEARARQQDARARQREAMLHARQERGQRHLNRLQLTFEERMNPNFVAPIVQRQEPQRQEQREAQQLRQQQQQGMLERQAEIQHQTRGARDLFNEQWPRNAGDAQFDMLRMPLFNGHRPPQRPNLINGELAGLVNDGDGNDLFAAPWHPRPAHNNGRPPDGHQAVFTFTNGRPGVTYMPTITMGAGRQNIPRHHHHVFGGHVGLGHNPLGAAHGVAEPAAMNVLGNVGPVPNHPPARPPPPHLGDGGFEVAERGLDRLDMLRRLRLEQTQQRRV